jgi:hypothetical protein
MSPRALSLAVWAALGGAVVALQLLALATRRVATLSGLGHLLARVAPVRAFLLLGWMWLGWHLFAR